MSIMDFLGDFGGGFDAVGGGNTLASIMAERRAMDVTNQEQMAYQGLLQKYGVGQGMQGEIPASFFLEAAQMPSIRSQMLTGAQSQAGAMGRQQQQQGWGMNNMSLADQTRMQNQQQQFQQSFDQTGQHQANQIQQGVLDREARQEQAANTLAAQQAKFQQQTGGTGIMPGTDRQWNQGVQELLPGSKEYQTIQTSVDDARSLIENVDVYSQYIKGGIKSTADKGKAEKARANIVQSLAKLNEAGALQEADIEFYSTGLPEVGSWSDKTTSDPRVQGAISQLQDQIYGGLADTFNNYPALRRDKKNAAMLSQAQPYIDKRTQANTLLGR